VRHTTMDMPRNALGGPGSTSIAETHNGEGRSTNVAAADVGTSRLEVAVSASGRPAVPPANTVWIPRQSVMRPDDPIATGLSTHVNECAYPRRSPHRVTSTHRRIRRLVRQTNRTPTASLGASAVSCATKA